MKMTTTPREKIIFSAMCILKKKVIQLAMRSLLPGISLTFFILSSAKKKKTEKVEKIFVGVFFSCAVNETKGHYCLNDVLIIYRDCLK